MTRSKSEKRILQHEEYRRDYRGGFSLMELFLVIAILSVLTMVSWPMLRRPLNKSVVQDAAQQLQRDLTSIRMQAVEAGRNLMFQFRPGSATYYLGDTDQRQVEDIIRSNRGIDARNQEHPEGPPPSNSDRDAVATGDELLEMAPKELPDGTFFAISNEKGDLTESPPENWGEENGKTTKTTADVELNEWSAPIRFYPSGRNNPARICLASDQGYFVEVEIQGIAGRVKITPIHR